MAAKTTTGKTPAKRPAAARKAVTAARSATARAGKGDGEPLEGAVIVGDILEEDEADDEGPAATTGSSYDRPDRDEVTIDPGLSFTSTVKDRAAEGIGEERAFEVDGEIYIARRPVDDSFVLLSTASASSTPMGDRIASILEFLGDVVDEEDQRRLRARMKDPHDDFSFTDLLPIMQKVVATFSRKGPKQARAAAAPPRR